MERREGRNKVLHRDALAQGQRPIHFTVFLTGKAFLSYTAVHVASSLNPYNKSNVANLSCPGKSDDTYSLKKVHL